MGEIFTSTQDAYDKLAVQPAWKPHTLAKRIEQLETPTTTRYHGRRKQVAMSYERENVMKEAKQRSSNRLPNGSNNINEQKAWTSATTGTPATTTTQTEPEETTNSNTQKHGANKYKIAAETQDQRMKKMESNIETIIRLQQQTKAEMQDDMTRVKDHQDATKVALVAVFETVTENRKQIEANKKETDNTLRMFRASLALLDQAMDKPSGAESPPRKISRPTIPPEDKHMSNEEESDSDSLGSISINLAPKSDDQMHVVAGGN
jgi:hypothetical protein